MPSASFFPQPGRRLPQPISSLRLPQLSPPKILSPPPKFLCPPASTFSAAAATTWTRRRIPPKRQQKGVGLVGNKKVFRKHFLRHVFINWHYMGVKGAVSKHFLGREWQKNYN